MLPKCIAALRVDCRGFPGSDEAQGQCDDIQFAVLSRSLIVVSGKARFRFTFKTKLGDMRGKCYVHFYIL